MELVELDGGESEAFQRLLEHGEDRRDLGRHRHVHRPLQLLLPDETVINMAWQDRL